MFISDISIKRPVLAIVVNLLLVAFGIVSFAKLALREYPDIDPPIVSISTEYRGASAEVIENKITKLIEDRVAGIEGIESIDSQSVDGRSQITIKFGINRNIDDAAGDVRDRVSGILNNLPEEALAPTIQKANADDEVILWFTLSSSNMSIMQLTDYAKKYLVDGFSAIDGVARVQIGGAQEMAMKIWLNPTKLASLNLTVSDIEKALKQQNIELPSGYIESLNRDFTVRVKRDFVTETDFKNLVIKSNQNGYAIRLKDVAKVKVEAVEKRNLLRSNNKSIVGIGIIKQSKSNIVEVAKKTKAEMKKVNQNLPNQMKLETSYDTSVFVERAVSEVYHSFFIAIILVIAVIFVFLGNIRATIIPAITVPVSIIASFIVILALGFTLNLLTLLALVLAIGLVVDDAIVVIENIYHRIEKGEDKLVAAYLGTRQVGFAVIVTTIVLAAVFLPIAFLEGDVGRLFSEFAMSIAAAVLFSGFVALTLSPMLASKMLDPHLETKFSWFVNTQFAKLKERYLRALTKVIDMKKTAIASLLICLSLSFICFKILPKEFMPKEDRGVLYLVITAPEGSSYNYVIKYVNEIEHRLSPFLESGEFSKLLMRVPGSFYNTASFNDARGIIVLSDWGKRKPIGYYQKKIQELTSDLTGVKVFPVARQAFSGWSKPVQFVIGGDSYPELVKWRDIIMKEAKNNPNLIGLDYDYKETNPQIEVKIDRIAAAHFGISTSDINSALETLLGSKRVTSYIDKGEEYYVILESEKRYKHMASDIKKIFVRSEVTGALVSLSNLLTIKEFADSKSLNRYNRLRSITIESNLAPGYSLDKALSYLENLVKTKLPPTARIDYKGTSWQYKQSGNSSYFIFLLALIVVFLLLAGQFESFKNASVIMVTVPLAITGALLALLLSGLSLNIYSQIGLIVLIGIAAKNGILIVEFANQLRDEGVEFKQAILTSSSQRLRPIIMTSLTTSIGAMPLIFSSGAGSETRIVIGVVISAGVLIATIFTMFLVPAIYVLISKNTMPPLTITRRLEAMIKK